MFPQSLMSKLDRAESPESGVKSLMFKMERVESPESGVRSWIFRLLWPTLNVSQTEVKFPMCLRPRSSMMKGLVAVAARACLRRMSLKAVQDALSPLRVTIWDMIRNNLSRGGMSWEAMGSDEGVRKNEGEYWYVNITGIVPSMQPNRHPELLLQAYLIKI